MVGQAGIAPARSLERHLLYRQLRVFSGLLAQTENGCGNGNRTRLKRLMRPPRRPRHPLRILRNGGTGGFSLPHEPACKAGAFPVEPRSHPKTSQHGGQVSRLHELDLEASAFLVEPPPYLLQRELMRLPGVAPGSPPWQRSILLLNHGCASKKSRLASVVIRGLPGTRHPGPRPGMKEQTPLQSTRRRLHPLESFHGGLSVFRAHPPTKPLPC